LKAAAKHKHTYRNIQQIPVNWDPLGLEHLVSIKWLPQLCQVLCEDLEMYKKRNKLPFNEQQNYFKECGTYKYKYIICMYFR